MCCRTLSGGCAPASGWPPVLAVVRMSDDYAFVYTERDMRAIIQAERERIASLLEDYGYGDAAMIARNGGQ